MAIQLPVIIQAEAPDKPEEIDAFVKQVLLLVNNNIVLNKPVERNCKLVLIELITNAIKHVKGYQNIIEIHIENNILKIRKIDKGPGLSIEKLKKDNSYIRNYIISEEDNCTLIFVDKDNRIENDVILFPENFGFEIITKASQYFSYSYDETNKSNIFTAIIQS